MEKTKSRKFLKPLLIVIIFVFLIETMIAVMTDRLPPRHSPQRVLKLLDSTTENSEALIFGDSFATNAFYAKDKILAPNDPIVTDALSLSSNTAITMAGQYFLLKRYLATHEKPERIFLIFSSGAWEVGLGPHSDNHFFSMFTQWSEIHEIWKATENPVFLAKMLYYKLFPSGQLRLYWAEFQGKSEAARKRMIRFLKEYWFKAPSVEKKEALFQISRPRPILERGSKQAVSETVQKKVQTRREKKETKPVVSKNVNLEFFDKICSLCQREGIKLYYLDATLPETTFNEKSLDQLVTIGKQLEERCPSMMYANFMTPLAMGDNWFYDRVHFNQEGSEIYLQEFSRAYKNLMETGN